MDSPSSSSPCCYYHVLLLAWLILAYRPCCSNAFDFGGKKDCVPMNPDTNATCSAPVVDPNDSKRMTMDCTAGDSVTFVTIGDWGIAVGNAVTAAIANAIFQDRARFDWIGTTGDNFYSDGVTSTTDPQWTTTWYNRFRVDDMAVHWLPVLGNHDYRNNPQAQVEYSTSNQPGATFWNMPHAYYSLDVNLANDENLKLIFLDTETLSTNLFSFWTETDQYVWFEQQLAEARATSTTTIILGHHHLESSGYRWINFDRSAVTIRKLTRNYKDVAKVYISGHEHSMEHLFVEHYLDVYISGGGGARTRTARFPWSFHVNSDYLSNTHGYAIHTLRPNQMITKFKTYRKDGTQIETKEFCELY